MAKKNILIIGPIVDFGGREVMTNLLAHALKDTYTINVLSTTLMTKNSVALNNLSSNQWSTLSQMAYNKNVFLKLTAVLTKVVNKRKEPACFFINNKFSKPFFNFETLALKAIKTVTIQADLIIYSDEISGKWLKHIIEISKKVNNALLLRLTGKIKSVPSYLIDKTHNYSILAHSKQNAYSLKAQLDCAVYNIDQTSALEQQILSLPITENKTLTYGFLGRFSEEKGINELIEVFSKNNKEIVFAGNGPFLDSVLKLTQLNENSTYIGELSPSQITTFFDKIDVFIIPSFEEGGPIVGLEAMAAGKLIISTKVGAMPERLEFTGNEFWFSHDAKNSLDEAINTIEKLSKTQRLKIRKQLRDKYVANNSLQSIKQQYLELIKMLIN